MREVQKKMAKEVDVTEVRRKMRLLDGKLAESGWIGRKVGKHDNTQKICVYTFFYLKIQKRKMFRVD